MRGTTPQDVRKVNKVLERAEKKNPIYDHGRIIVDEAQLGFMAESRCSTRKHLAPYRLEEVELHNDGCRLDAAGALWVLITEY